MDEQKGRNDRTPKPDEHALPVGKRSPADSPKESVAAPPIPPVIEQNIGPASPNNPSPHNPAGNPNTLPVRDELSRFERITLRYARWGFGGAIVTVLIAIGTGWIFFGQFKEMVNQTDVGQFLTPTINLISTGKTPALNVYGKIRI